MKRIPISLAARFHHQGALVARRLKVPPMETIPTGASFVYDDRYDYYLVSKVMEVPEEEEEPTQSLESSNTTPVVVVQSPPPARIEETSTEPQLTMLDIFERYAKLLPRTKISDSASAAYKSSFRSAVIKYAKEFKGMSPGFKKGQGKSAALNEVTVTSFLPTWKQFMEGQHFHGATPGMGTSVRHVWNTLVSYDKEVERLLKAKTPTK
jgi:hypothetical protein